MAVLGSRTDEADVVSFRKAIFRMILSRAKTHLTDPLTSRSLTFLRRWRECCFDRLDSDQRARLLEAVYEGTQDLKQQILAGEPTEEEVRPDIEEKLDEILALLSRYRQ